MGLTGRNSPLHMSRVSAVGVPEAEEATNRLFDAPCDPRLASELSGRHPAIGDVVGEDDDNPHGLASVLDGAILAVQLANEPDGRRIALLLPGRMLGRSLGGVAELHFMREVLAEGPRDCQARR